MLGKIDGNYVQISNSLDCFNSKYWIEFIGLMN